ncbi:MAG: hypothetical protein CMP22_07350, partial [Rickettsiales bacterium]|nr:hypothetical protein [Rickettsiales bacterium]
MKYIPPLNALPGDEEDDNRSYWNADPSGANLPLRQGAYPDARGFESVQREILNVITGAGITPDENDLTQLFDAVQALGGFDVVSPTTETDISDGDFMAFADVSAANANKKITFLNLLGKIIPRILIKDYTNQETLNDADYVPFEDVSNSNANRKVTLAALKAFIVSGVTTPDATTTTKGKVELATDAEVKNETASKVLTADQIK